MPFANNRKAELPLQRAGLLSPALGALGAVALIFVLFELTERLWLREYGPELTYWAHFARGLISSFAAALVVGLLVYRASASLRAADLTTRDWIRGERPIPEERNRYYALWLIQLRWIAVVVAAGLVMFTSASGRLSPDARLPIVMTITALAFVNAGYAALTRYPALNRRLLPVQSYSDLIFLAVLLHFSGGIENPLWIALIFQVAISGIVLGRHHCFTVAAAAAVLFTLVAGGEAIGLLDHHFLSVMPHAQQETEHLLHAGAAVDYVLTMILIVTGTLFLVAYFVTTLGDRIREDEQQLSALADRALAERQLLEQALVTTETGLCVFDTHLNPLWKNERWEKWFPDGPDETTAGMLGEPRTRVAEVALRDVPAGDDTGNGETNVQLTTGAMHDGEGRINRVVALAQDITAQKQVQGQMVRAERLAAVGELAGHVAHEVNNPVGIISAKTRLLLSNRRSEISDRVAEELAKITDLADRIADLVGRLLSYCRTSPSVRTPIDVRNPIREAISLVADRARKSGTGLEEHLEASLPKVRGNARELQQVVVNLLLNALDAIPDGGRITVGARSDLSGWVKVFVHDTGSGIPAELRQTMFEPFVTSKPEGRGTGLGLSVCDGLVRSHGGWIEVESEPGRGTRVTFAVPMAEQAGDVA